MASTEIDIAIGGMITTQTNTLGAEMFKELLIPKTGKIIKEIMGITENKECKSCGATRRVNNICAYCRRG